jgi:cobalamin-dependent methionine synthase I
MNKTYNISELTPYINWLYFYHAWGLSGKPREDKEKMKQEALQMLASWEEKYHTHAIFRLFEVCSEGDDLIFFLPGTRFRFPMLRQQHPSAPGEPNLCLADFIRPLSQGIRDQAGVFCTSVDGTIIDEYSHDDYLNMMAQTLSDRLAEATAEKLHEEVRKDRAYWGYAPDENLTIEQQHREEYQGIRPAIGYPSLPDTSANFLIDQLIDMKQAGIRLTETGMMTPHASVSGFMFAHPKSHYFELGKIGDDQLRDYARRRGVPVELMRRFLAVNTIR